MKSEWKVYIKGVPNRGDEVIKALLDLGAKHDSYCGSGSNDDFIYYIDHKGEINYENLDSEMAKIIMDNYNEIKLPEKLKDGDLLVCHMLYGNRYAVYSDDSELMKCNTITTYVAVDNYYYNVNGLFDKEDFKLASDEEYDEFYDLLHKHGKDWDAEKKHVVDWTWKPKNDKWYYYVFSDGTIHSCAWHDDRINNSHFNIGNCFRNYEEAENMAKKFKKLLKENHEKIKQQ